LFVEQLHKSWFPTVLADRKIPADLAKTEAAFLQVPPAVCGDTAAVGARRHQKADQKLTD